MALLKVVQQGTEQHREDLFLLLHSIGNTSRNSLLLESVHHS